MTPAQKEIAEKAIQLHKDNDGVYDWYTLMRDKSIVGNITFDNLKVIQQLLFEKGLIVLLHPEGSPTLASMMSMSNISTTRLTLAGYAFKGFADEEKKALKKEREERAKSWPQRHFFLWSVILVTTSTAISVGINTMVTLYITDKKTQQNLQYQQPLLIDTTKKVQGAPNH